MYPNKTWQKSGLKYQTTKELPIQFLKGKNVNTLLGSAERKDKWAKFLTTELTFLQQKLSSFLKHCPAQLTYFSSLLLYFLFYFPLALSNLPAMPVCSSLLHWTEVHHLQLLTYIYCLVSMHFWTEEFARMACRGLKLWGC